jgi:hypothetical protein
LLSFLTQAFGIIHLLMDTVEGLLPSNICWVKGECKVVLELSELSTRPWRHMREWRWNSANVNLCTSANPCRSLSGEASVPCVSSRPDLYATEIRKKISCPYRESNTQLMVAQPVIYCMIECTCLMNLFGYILILMAATERKYSSNWKWRVSTAFLLRRDRQLFCFLLLLFVLIGITTSVLHEHFDLLNNSYPFPSYLRWDLLALDFLQSWVAGPASNPRNIEGSGIFCWGLLP